MGAHDERGRIIAHLFTSFGMHIQPEAVRMILECGNDFESIVKELAARFKYAVVISEDDVSCFIREKSGKSEKKTVKGNAVDSCALTDATVASEARTAPDAMSPVVLRSFADVHPQRDFLHIFRDRYERLSGILRRHARGAMQIRALMNAATSGGGRLGEEVSVIGIVSSMRKTARGNTVVEIEDMTGEIHVILRRGNAEDIIEDEVICVSGRLLDSGYLLANSVTRPDVPLIRGSEEATAENDRTPASSSGSGIDSEHAAVHGAADDAKHAIFISDVHAGSKTFIEDAWCAFIDWIRENASAIAYLVVAGDIVDGIGVYPEQEKDLMLRDVEEQYALVASHLKRIPSSVHIILSPGNHDAVRNAEPQPPLPPHIQRMFPPNTTFVSNPSYVEIAGRIVLIYHGQSYDDFISAIPRLRYERPEEVMVEMLKRRHLAPIYGKNVSLFPAMHDYGVIDPIPDIMHCGHAHTYGVTSYRHVLLINSGTWQSQTSYQRKRGIAPVTCHATIVNLAEMRVSVKVFA